MQTNTGRMTNKDIAGRLPQFADAGFLYGCPPLFVERGIHTVINILKKRKDVLL